jgi:branched-chain amino acid transport system permease protein
MTEILLAILLMFMLALRPGGIVQTAELGAGLRRRRGAPNSSEDELAREA